MLNEMERTERNSYARMLIQENLIAATILALFRSVELCPTPRLRGLIPGSGFDYPKLEKYTLGQLLKVANPLLSKQTFRKLDRFKKLRNDLTHNILFKYDDWEKMSADAGRVVKRGSAALKSLRAKQNAELKNSTERYKKWRRNNSAKRGP